MRYMFKEEGKYLNSDVSENDMLKTMGEPGHIFIEYTIRGDVIIYSPDVNGNKIIKKVYREVTQ